MARKSVLTPDQWIEAERRALIDGESINSIAKFYGVNESIIRRKIKPNKAESPNGTNQLRVIAEKKVRADADAKRIAEEIAELPYAKQQIVSDLARKLSNIGEHLCSAAEYGAATAHRLAGIANSKVSEIDDASPLDEDSMVALKGIAVLTRMANESSEIGINLLRANKETVDDLNKLNAPQGFPTVIKVVGVKAIEKDGT